MANNNRKTVTNIDQTNKGILCNVIPGALMLNIVVIKLAAPSIDDAPARWSEKIAKSIHIPGEPAELERGG